MNLELYNNIVNKYNRDIKLLDDEPKSVELKHFLDVLYENKIIVLTKRGFIKKIKKEKLFVGKLDKKENFGFLIIPNKDDMYVQNINNYFNNDIVLCIQSFDRGKKDSVKILDLLKREDSYLILKKEQNKIIPVNSNFKNDIILKGIDQEQIKNGTIFSVKIIDVKNNNLFVSLHNIITDENDPDKEMKIVLEKYKIDVDFSEKTISELDDISEEVKIEDFKNRKNLTDQLFFTIDGDDSKDLDDAISLIKEGEDYRLFVSIADVSYYIKPKTNLDKDALNRATSVYFIDRVVPMLPKKISNGICSLHAGVNRLSMTCEMLIDKNGQTKDIKIYESIINSKYRLTYNKINRLLEHDDKEVINEYLDIYSILKEMNKLAKKLNKKRLRRGSFNLEDTEAKFKLDDKQNIIDIKAVHRGDSEKLIEEFMIVANESVTKYVTKDNYPFIYRTHGRPKDNKLDDLKNMLNYLKINVDLDYDNIRPKDFKKILDKVDNPIFKRILTKTIVRSMQKAEYTVQNIGHFGLASNNYTHFTSPIRRYPDLEVHRLIKHYLNNDKLKESEKKQIKDIAYHSSQKEISAIKAQQEIEDLKKAQYMKKYIGDTFESTVSSIEDYGIFVELDNTIRGLIRFNDLQNFKSQTLYKVEFFKEEPIEFGNKLEVVVAGVDTQRGLVDFLPKNYEIKTEEQKQATNKRKNSTKEKKSYKKVKHNKTNNKFSKSNKNNSNKKTPNKNKTSKYKFKKKKRRS